MHIMDIFQNAISANATLISLDIVEDTHANLMRLEIGDNGIGMSQQMQRQVTDPFFTTRTLRKIGLGIPLLKQNAERTGGFFRLESEEGIGTRVIAQFVLDHLDRPVLGDVPGIMVLAVMANPQIGFTYTHLKDKKLYRFSSMEVKEALGDIPVNEPMVYKYLHEMITENLEATGVTLTS